MWKILLKSEVSIKQIYIIRLYIPCRELSGGQKVIGGGWGWQKQIRIVAVCDTNYHKTKVFTKECPVGALHSDP